MNLSLTFIAAETASAANLVIPGVASDPPKIG